MKSVFARSVMTVAAFFFLGLTTSASAATVVVDDDRAQCPAAGHTSVQAGVDAADDGDTVVVCPGIYVEGSGTPGTNAVTIDKEIDLLGAGADLVTIMPKRATAGGGQIASLTPVLRDPVGAIIAVTGGTPLFPAEVDISGVTVEGNGVFAEAGILYLDGKGRIYRSRVTKIVTSQTADAYDIPGGFRSSDTGYGIVQATSATSAPAGGSVPRRLVIESTRVDEYNKTGILIDGATGDSLPLVPSGVNNTAEILGSNVVGRLRCINFLATGNCATVGTLTTGPLFGQDGLRVTAGASVDVEDTSFFQNYVNGTGAPTFSPNTGTPSSTNNANLSQAAGVRLIGAGASSITGSNINNNHFGAFNVELDGVTANVATPLAAEENWWGLRTTGATVNNGPAISPTNNPAQQENPVNGSPVVDPACQARSITLPESAPVEIPGSDAVDFCPYRNGAQADPQSGEHLQIDAPLPMNDAGPAISLSLDKAQYLPGESAELSATVSDDFAVAKVTFYDGLVPIGSSTLPPYETSIAIPADAVCSERTLSAIVEDSTGQTDGATATLKIVDQFDCEDPPDPPAEPTISLDVPAVIPNRGVTATASVNAEAGATSVVFFLGTRTVCTDTDAPYSCLIKPTGAEVGTQSVRAVVTDNLSRTAEDSASVRVSKFTPRIRFEIKRPGVRWRVIKGTLVLPAGVTRAQACNAGRVTLTVRGGGRATINRQVRINRFCVFKTRVFVGKPEKGKKRRYAVKAVFPGNAVLNGATNTRRFS